jgi:hypothetical protein
MTVLRRLRMRLAIAFLIVTSSQGQQYVISTVAGGAPPITPAAATSLAIYPPVGVTVDSEGNVFFTSVECVFRLDRKGILTRVAGLFRGGFSGDGRLAENAQLSAPAGLAFDSSGNLFIADSYNARIRRISKTGIITTVAGNGDFKPFGHLGTEVRQPVHRSRRPPQLPQMLSATSSFRNIPVAGYEEFRLTELSRRWLVGAPIPQGTAGQLPARGYRTLRAW